jgi:3',5'-cyclic AMP phosphodiesterase CpdA
MIDDLDRLSEYRRNDAIAAFPRIKIVHVSDLHFVVHPILKRLDFCGGLQGHDPDTVTALEQAVCQLKPDLLFATGDHSTWGDKTSLKHARKFLLDLASRVCIPPEYVFWIPGNHDVLLNYYFGIPLWEKSYDRVFGKIPVAQAVSVAGYDVAVFSFDSTLQPIGQKRSLLTPVVGSRGTVSRRSFNDFNAATQGGAFGEDFFKIAQIHHHPLPIPYKTTGAIGLELTTMDNGGTFVAYMQASGMNLVLHGHEHYPYSCRYCFDPNVEDTIIVAAGTGCQRHAHINSFNYIEVVPQKRIVITQYNCSHVGFRVNPNSTKVFTFTQ